MCQSAWASAALMIYSLSGRGLESNCRQEETAPLCYPPGGINVLLTQESMTPVDNSKVCPVSSLSRYARVVLWPRCKLEEHRQRRLRGRALENRSGASFYGELAQQIWLKTAQRGVAHLSANRAEPDGHGTRILGGAEICIWIDSLWHGVQSETCCC